MRSATIKINTTKLDNNVTKLNDISKAKEPLLKNDAIIHVIAHSNYYPTDYSHAKNDPLKKKILKALIKKNSFSALFVQGHIITDFINVLGKKKIYFIHEGKKVELNIVGYDKLTSIAVLKPAQSAGLNMKPYNFSSRKAVLGESVKVISFDRFFASLISKIYKIKEGMMLDRSLPANSYGAAVVSSKGDLLGMVKAKKLIIADSDNIHDSVVSIDTLNDVVSQIIKYGRVVRGFCGLILDGQTIISITQGSSASAVGLKEGMSIIKINNQSQVNNFKTELNKAKPGDIVNIIAEYTNPEGQKASIEVAFYVGEKISILERITGHNINIDVHVFSDQNMKNALYFQSIDNLPSELQEEIAQNTSKLKSYDNVMSGIFVLDVDKGNAIFKRRDIIKSINNHDATLNEMYSSCAMLKSGVIKSIILTVIRDDNIIKVKIEKKHIA